MGFLGGAIGGFAKTGAEMKKKGKKGLLRRGRKRPQTFQPATVDPETGVVPPQDFKRGGKVRRTGLVRAHKGERVLTPKQARKYRKRAAKRR